MEGVVNGKAESRQDTETLLKNSVKMKNSSPKKSVGRQLTDS